MKLRYTSCLTLAAVTVTACSGDVVDATGTRPAPANTVLAASFAGSEAQSAHGVILKNKNAAAAVSAQVASLGGKVTFSHPAVGLLLVHGLSESAAAAVAANAGVQEIVRDEAFTLDTPSEVLEAEAPSDAVSSVANPATASRYSWQWNMRLISADDAWAAGKLGSPAVTVAILDSGIDYDINDMNGLVDLARSTSFVPSDTIFSKALNRHPFDDFHGHGTNVATQVSSKALALAGVTSKTTLMAVKVIGASGSGSTLGVLAGVLYAADNGADIANMSLGSYFLKKDGKGVHSLFNKVFNYARQQGMLIVVASGNDLRDLDHNTNGYAAYCDAPGVVCVSSVGPRKGVASDNDEPAYYTNYGRSSIAVAAPGGSGDAANNFPAIYAYPWGTDHRSWVWSYCPKNRIVFVSGVPFLTVCNQGNRLSGYVGTSQASPHVAGMAALMLAEGTSKNNLKNAISQAVDHIGNGNTAFHGAGRINVAKAVGIQ